MVRFELTTQGAAGGPVTVSGESVVTTRKSGVVSGVQEAVHHVFRDAELVAPDGSRLRRRRMDVVYAVTPDGRMRYSYWSPLASDNWFGRLAARAITAMTTSAARRGFKPA